jgi:purine-binding chemotaxis protein CheW
MSNAIKQSGAYLEIVSFHLGEQEFCIDIMVIREIRGWAPVTPMPHTPPYVLGLINLRGAVIPVIDMACRLGMKMTEPSERAAIIVTDIAGKLVGLLVEQVSDMMTIKSEELQQAPEIIPEAQPRHRGARKVDGLFPQPRHSHRRRTGPSRLSRLLFPRHARRCHAVFESSRRDRLLADRVFSCA